MGLARPGGDHNRNQLDGFFFEQIVNHPKVRIANKGLRIRGQQKAVGLRHQLQAAAKILGGGDRSGVGKQFHQLAEVGLGRMASANDLQVHSSAYPGSWARRKSGHPWRKD